MSKFKDRLEALARHDDADARLAAAVELDSEFDGLPDSSEMEERISALEGDLARVTEERDKYLKRYVDAYFTSPGEAGRQGEHVQKDSHPKSIDQLFSDMEGN